MKTLTTTEYTSNPTAPAMSADEFSTFLAQEKLERTLANIARRASRLWEDGYTCKQTFQGTFVTAYDVLSPRGDRYMVKLTPTPKDAFLGDKCTCPAFEKYGECKHHLAIQWKLREEAQCDAYDTLHAFDDFNVDDYEFANFCGEGCN